MDFEVTQLSEVTKDFLMKNDLHSARQIARFTKDEIRKKGLLDEDDIKELLFTVSDAILNTTNICSNEVYQRITTGCRKIDKILGGGLYMPSGIIEVAGESGCGKTQLCLQLCLTAQNPVNVGGTGKGVVYICTEDKFPLKRFDQLMKNIKSPFSSCEEFRYGDRLFIEHVADVKCLLYCLNVRLPLLLSQGIGLVIVDSVAAVFRAEYGDARLRAPDLRNVGYQLHHLARTNGLCVLCINQVTAVVGRNSGTGCTIPALGMVWTNLVTTRIMMRKIGYSERVIESVFSPHCGNDSCRFMITEDGVRGI